jgi:hypothetical protein
MLAVASHVPPRNFHGRVEELRTPRGPPGAGTIALLMG